MFHRIYSSSRQSQVTCDFFLHGCIMGLDILSFPVSLRIEYLELRKEIISTPCTFAKPFYYWFSFCISIIHFLKITLCILLYQFGFPDSTEIIAAADVTHIHAAVTCAKRLSLQLRIRSGGTTMMGCHIYQQLNS